MNKPLMTALVTVAAATPAIAATEYSYDGGILVGLFLGFAAFIVLFQLVPAIILIVSMIKALFPGKEEQAVESEEQGE